MKSGRKSLSVEIRSSKQKTSERIVVKVRRSNLPHFPMTVVIVSERYLKHTVVLSSLSFACILKNLEEEPAIGILYC